MPLLPETISDCTEGKDARNLYRLANMLEYQTATTLRINKLLQVGGGRLMPFSGACGDMA